MSNKKEHSDAKGKINKSSYAEYTDFIKNLAKIADSTQLNEIEFKENNIHIRIKKDKDVINTSYNIPNNIPQQAQTQAIVSPQIQVVQPEVKVEIAENYAKHSGAVLSPMVGVVYTAPNPDSSDFVKVGDVIKEGDTLLLIEAMKVFNTIKAHKGGTVSKILVNNNEPVEFNQPLIVIE